MAITFNASEILDMAIRIEQNGARYYRKAAEQFTDDHAVKMLNELAGWEDGHERIFESMQAELQAPDAANAPFDPNGQVSLYLGALADGNVFDFHADPAKELTGSESLEDVLRKAIALEKDSVVFYLGLREMVPPQLGRERVDKIIAEEMSHIGYLNKELSTIKAGGVQ